MTDTVTGHDTRPAAAAPDSAGTATPSAVAGRPARPAVPDMTPADVADAAKKAREAFDHFRHVPVARRAELLRRIRGLLVDRTDEMVGTIVEETGKLATEAVVNEVFVAAEHLSYYAHNASRFLAPERVSPGLFGHKAAEKRFEPLGVVGVISPWNYPLVLTMGPVSTALVAGDTVVLKPSEFTPRTGLLVADIVNDAACALDLPDLVQVVTGRGDVGEALVRAGLAKIAFTGSVRTGKAVMRAAADTLTPVLLELGGKDPMIVRADADLDRAARAAVWGAFTNCGQTCMATERVYVNEAVYDRFVDKVVGLTAALRQGDGPDADVGAMTHEGQLALVERHLTDATNRGATVATGGTRTVVGGRPSMAPTVLLDVDHTMAVMRDETFGPLLPIMKVHDDDEALRLANDSPYGLNASVFGKDAAAVERLVAGLESGNVCVNDVMVSFAIPSLPFGGVKDSGVGRSHGPEGLREFTQVKAVARDRLGLKREAQWLPLPRQLGRVVRLALRLRYGRGGAR